MAAGAARNRVAGGEFLFLSTVGNHALMPLLFGATEYPIKVWGRRTRSVIQT